MTPLSMQLIAEREVSVWCCYQGGHQASNKTREEEKTTSRVSSVSTLFSYHNKSCTWNFLTCEKAFIIKCLPLFTIKIFHTCDATSEGIQLNDLIKNITIFLFICLVFNETLVIFLQNYVKKIISMLLFLFVYYDALFNPSQWNCRNVMCGRNLVRFKWDIWSKEFSWEGEGLLWMEKY